MPKVQGANRGCRKHGRKAKKPAQMNYTSSRRWITNKAKRIIRYMKRHPKWNPGNLSSDVTAKVNQLSN